MSSESAGAGDASGLGPPAALNLARVGDTSGGSSVGRPLALSSSLLRPLGPMVTADSKPETPSKVRRIAAAPRTPRTSLRSALPAQARASPPASNVPRRAFLLRYGPLRSLPLPPPLTTTLPTATHSLTQVVSEAKLWASLHSPRENGPSANRRRLMRKHSANVNPRRQARAGADGDAAAVLAAAGRSPGGSGEPALSGEYAADARAALAADAAGSSFAASVAAAPRSEAATAAQPVSTTHPPGAGFSRAGWGESRSLSSSPPRHASGQFAAAAASSPLAALIAPLLGGGSMLSSTVAASAGAPAPAAASASTSSAGNERSASTAHGTPTFATSAAGTQKLSPVELRQREDEWERWDRVQLERTTAYVLSAVHGRRSEIGPTFIAVRLHSIYHSKVWKVVLAIAITLHSALSVVEAPQGYFPSTVDIDPTVCLDEDGDAWQPTHPGNGEFYFIFRLII